MKKFLLIIIAAIFIIPQFTNGQQMKWRRLIAKDTYDMWVNKYNPNTIFAGGGGRIVYRSYDAGMTWDTLVIGYLSGAALFNNVLIHPNDTNVVLCGGLNFGSIRRSTDHGETWDIALDDPIGKISLNGKAMLMKPGAEDTIYVGEFRSGRIFRSTDRGATWDSISVIGHIEQVEDENGELKDTLMPSEIACMGIRSDSSDVLLMGSTNSEVWISTDGGFTWDVTDTLVNPDILQSDSEITRITFSDRDPLVGYAVITYLFGFNKNNGGLHKTTDGGYSWDMIAFPDTSMWAAAVRGVNGRDEVFIGGYTEDFYLPDSLRIPGVGMVRRSQDGGKTWWSYDEGINWWLNLHTYRSVFFVDAKSGFVVGDRGLIERTNDSASNWHRQASYVKVALNSVYFTNDTIGYVAGNDGTLLKTINRASVFDEMETNTKHDLHDIWFVDDQTGYVAGDYGTILKTTNAGELWEKSYDETEKPHFYSIRFINSQLGFACGSGGNIVKTTNGGKEWRILDSGIQKKLNSIFFVDELVGYACGIGSRVLKTTDGGESWSNVSPETEPYNKPEFLSCWFDNEDYGMAFGRRAAIFLTTDGGENWTRKYIKSRLDIFDSYFIDNKTGYISLQNHGLWRTTDSGNTWHRMSGYGPKANMWSLRYFGPPGQEKLYMASEAGLFVLDHPSPVDHEVEEAIKPKFTARASGSNVIINYSSGLPNPQGSIHIDIAELSGRIIHSSDINKFGGDIEKMIELPELPAGAYFIRVIENGVISVDKFILQ